MDALMEFRVLGPLEAIAGGEQIPLGGAKQRALLAVLLLNANRVVSTDRLIDDLWGERPPATAAHSIQVYVSQLRKALGRERLTTQKPGYLLRVQQTELDLHRFEQLLGKGREALGAGDAEAAAQTLRAGLELWRGPALAEFEYDSFAQSAITRLEELRLAAVEERIEADLALGRHAELVGELEALVERHPLRERARAQLMLAFYRSGRQAEALECFQSARRSLVDELGIDPSPALQTLHKQMLNQDAGLDWKAPRAAQLRDREVRPVERAILVLARGDGDISSLLDLAKPLSASLSPHELILVRLVEPPGEALGAVARELEGLRSALLDEGVVARSAAFTSTDLASDGVRLASQQDVDLALIDARAGALLDGELGTELRAMLEDAPCDVGLLVGGERSAAQGPIIVPFGGADHDWAALELGAWMASGCGVPLKIYGLGADDQTGRRDASRLLASASLVVQQLTGVAAEPALWHAPEHDLIAAAEEARLLVIGLSERWHSEGIGELRSAIATQVRAPSLVVRRGIRPGGLTPSESLTRFTWSLTGGGAGTQSFRPRGRRRTL
jgi:DNA-binding SARP family transcriptional activator